MDDRSLSNNSESMERSLLSKSISSKSVSLLVLLWVIRKSLKTFYGCFLWGTINGKTTFFFAFFLIVPEYISCLTVMKQSIFVNVKVRKFLKSAGSSNELACPHCLMKYTRIGIYFYDLM